MTEKKELLQKESLDLHASFPCGKLAVVATKPLETQKDLSLAYSPGVAAPCLEIQKNPEEAFRYTAKSNLVAVVSNGTAVLGLGDIGALASKPVMEGKAVLFKRFAGVNAIDIEVNSKDPDKVIETVALIGDGFGGVNLEDIKAPECFYIEKEIQKRLNVPVFHDDQHGTAVVVAAGLVNGLKLTGKKIEEIKLVVNGAGAAAIACATLLRSMGVQNIIMCDSKGVIYAGRQEGMNPFKEQFAVHPSDRTLDQAIENADVFLGLSVKGALTVDMIKKMAPSPIIFALANPDPEITPQEVFDVLPDAIVATGRSDYPNQINNVLGFPYIFRGALDVRASCINEQMKQAAASALAELARMDGLSKDKIIPSPFDPRLIQTVPVAVAKAACDCGVAGQPICDWEAYRTGLGEKIKKG